MNSTTVRTPLATVREKTKVSSAWELSRLLRPLREVRTNEPTAQPPSPPANAAAIVAWIWEQRFATAEQARRRFPEALPSPRTARRHLAALTQLNWLARAPVRSLSPNFPAVFLATPRGLRMALGAENGVGMASDTLPGIEEAKERGYASESILHELLITEFLLDVHSLVEARPDLTLLEVERRYFRINRQLRYRDRGEEKRVVPDAGFLLRVNTAESPAFLQMFIELDNGTMPVPRIAAKFLAYSLWAQTQEPFPSWAPEAKLPELLRQHPDRYRVAALYHRHGSQNPKPNFRLLVIAHDKTGTQSDDRRLLDLFTQALELPAEMRDRLWFATAAALKEAQRTGESSLATPVWFRARDAKTWLPAYKAHSAALPRRRGHKRYHHQRAFVAERLVALPQHSLFPHPTVPIFQTSS